MSTPTYDRELIARMLADYMWPDKIAGRAYRVEAIQKQIDALNAADAAGVRTASTTDPVRALPTQWRHNAQGCHPRRDAHAAGTWRSCARQLEDALASAPPSAPVGVEEMQRRLDRDESDHGRTIDQRDAAEDALGRMFQAVTGRPAEWSSAWGYVDAIEEVEEHVAALAQQPEAPAQVQAWMDPSTLDVIHADRKKAWAEDYGAGGKSKAAAYTVPLYTAPQPAIPEGTWRLLKKGEAIQRGDEILADNCVEWGPLCGWERGMAYDPAAFVPVRRRIQESDHG